MPFNIHWKGCPHHLPRIRTASSRSASIRGWNAAHTAAEDVFRLPISSAFQLLRKKQKAKRRQLSRSSHSSAAAVRARKRASVRARRDIQVFGWDSPRGALTNSSLRTRSAPSSIKANARAKPQSQPQNFVNGSTVGDSTDGALNSLLGPSKATKPENQYSLMQFAEVPVYWTCKEVANKKRTATGKSSLSRRAGAEYAHVGPLDPVSKRNTDRVSLGRSRAYDSRLKYRTVDNQANSKFSQYTKKENHPWGSVAFLEASPTSPSPRRSGSSPSIQSLVQSIISEAPSRTPSQKKALQRFTKELELYLLAARVAPKQTPVPSPPSTVFSANTIQELKPYQAEFQAAGLAVTSTEQRRESNAPIPPPIPPKDEMWLRKSTSSKMNKPRASTENKQQPERRRDEEQTRTDNTDTSVYIGWTDGYGDDSIVRSKAPAPRLPERKEPEPPSPRTSSKRSLPWLRKQETFAEPFPSFHNSSTKAVDVNWQTMSKPLSRSAPSPVASNITSEPESVSSSIVLHLDTPPEHKTYNERMYAIPEATKREDPRRPTEAKFNDLSYINVASQGSPSKDFGNHQSNTAKTSLPEADKTVFDNKKEAAGRAPITSGRRKTFPFKASRCSGDCRQVPIETTASMISPRLQAPRRNKDQVTQTDDFGRIKRLLQDEKKGQDLREITFDSTIKNDDGTLSTSPVGPQNAGPFQASPILRSPRRECEDGKDDMILDDNSSASTIRAPTRPAPLPLKCSKCGGEFDASLSVEAEIHPGNSPALEAESALRGGRQHICTSVTALQCAPPKLELSPTNLPVDSESQQPTTNIRVDKAATKIESLPKLEEQAAADLTAESAQSLPVPDPVKRLVYPRYSTRPKHTCSRKKRSAPLLELPLIFDTATSNMPASDTSTTCASMQSCGSDAPTSDKRVFKGLHVATAAAGDEDVDKWIEEIIGTSPRKFLADLSVFEGLGVITLAGVAKRAARHRRNEVRGWERVRERRLGLEDTKLGDDRVGLGMDRKMGLVAADESFNLQRLREEKKTEGEALIRQMMRMRDKGKQEGIRERAVEMGWSHRSVSGQL